MSGVILPPGQTYQILVSFNAGAIENGFVLTKTYIVQETGKQTVQVQRTYFHKDLKEVLASLQDDVAN